ncbi:MAG: hypothetical protein IT461_16170 [Planctomycetes bacterium]|nr:hypothetical protein [Planctomycetota bacterium]
MHGEHAEPMPQLQDLRHHLEEPEAIRPTDVTSVAKLLAELRHLLENGCTLSTALDVVDEAQAALQTMSRAGGAHVPAMDGTECLNLVELLNLALNEYACSIAESNIIVLNRKFARRMVRARKAELSALL